MDEDEGGRRSGSLRLAGSLFEIAGEVAHDPGQIAVSGLDDFVRDGLDYPVQEFAVGGAGRGGFEQHEVRGPARVLRRQ